jgi:hypothetical protein
MGSIAAVHGRSCIKRGAVIVASAALVLCMTGQPLDAGPLFYPESINVGMTPSAAVEKIRMALKSAENIHIFKFSAPCFRCQNAKLSVGDLSTIPPAVSLNTDDLRFFVTELSNPASYVPGGAQKSMPFIADYGFVLENASGESILLLSTYSQNVRLITQTPDSSVWIGNIDPIFPAVKERLDRIFK